MSATRRLLETHVRGDPIGVLSASGQLGFGIPADSFERGLARAPHFIGCDMGSIDPGPFYLGSGRMAAPAATVERDLEMVVCGARKLDVPLIIGSAGTAGAAPHLAATVEVVRRIAVRNNLRFRLATIASDLAVDLVLDAARQGRLHPIGSMSSPSEEDLRRSTHIVGQCGTGTFIEALEQLPDILIAGRACDTAIFAALPQMLGFDRALSLHMAKIIECTSLCCRPGGRDAMLATLGHDGFVLESMNPACHATPQSVAAHALYEQADPFRVEEPEGTLLLGDASYEALDEHRTRVWGARFEERDRPSLKVEAAAPVGARVVLIAGVTDPVMLERLPGILMDVERKVRAIVGGAWSRHEHLYGAGAVRPLDPSLRTAHEVGLVIEFIGEEPDVVRTAAGVYKQNLLHHAYPGRMSTAGNVAFPFTPSEFDANTAYRFTLYHVLEAPPTDGLFTVALCEIGSTADQA